VDIAEGVSATFVMVKSSGRQRKVEWSRPGWANICVCSETLAQKYIRIYVCR